MLRERSLNPGMDAVNGCPVGQVDELREGGKGGREGKSNSAKSQLVLKPNYGEPKKEPKIKWKIPLAIDHHKIHRQSITH